MVNVVPVDLGDRSYEVRIGPGLIARAGKEIAPLLKRKKVAVVTDETVAAIRSLVETDVHKVEGGRLPFADAAFDAVAVVDSCAMKVFSPARLPLLTPVMPACA